ncbi:MAG: TerB family tellurite resistance protein [Gammaproteobacteria bacterium]|nr:TerB family tellurite resistance protein [Gammaproteobacteria bacterium]
MTTSTSNAKPVDLAGVDTVVSQPLIFKAQLAIGEDAYISLKLKKNLYRLWDVMGAAGTAGAVASSSVVASTFFAKGGVLGLLGFGTAVTPLGWVIAASLAGGGAWYGVSKYLERHAQTRVQVIPHYINTPLDVLAVALYELMAAVALKISNVDTETFPAITVYFATQWGYHPDYAENALAAIAVEVETQSLDTLSSALANLLNQSPDCNYLSITNELLGFYRHLIDGVDDASISQIAAIFQQQQPKSLLQQLRLR